MATSSIRTKVTGDRTPRNMNSYQDKEGIRGTGYCKCGAVFHGKRWQSGSGETAALDGRKLVCPACRRIADQIPAGIISLRGDFLASHETEIGNIIRNTEQASAQKNPLGRVMETRKENDGTPSPPPTGNLPRRSGAKFSNPTAVN